MMLPSEFIESFEEQYPQPKLDYTLPESLKRCQLLDDKINNTVTATGELSFTYMDEAGATYDLLNRQYRTIQSPQWFKLEKNGYDYAFDKAYKTYAGNLSPRSFAFILEDLSEINAVKFSAALQIQLSKFTMEKSIALQKSWYDFCLKYPSKFKMDYSGYKETINKLDN